MPDGLAALVQGRRPDRSRRRLRGHALFRRRGPADAASATAPFFALRPALLRLLHQHRLVHRPTLVARPRSDRRQHAPDDGLGSLPAPSRRGRLLPVRPDPRGRLPRTRHPRHGDRAPRLPPAPEPRRRVRARVRHGPGALRRDARPAARSRRPRRDEAHERRLQATDPGARTARIRPAVVRLRRRRAAVAAGRPRCYPRVARPA